MNISTYKNSNLKMKKNINCQHSLYFLIIYKIINLEYYDP